MSDPIEPEGRVQCLNDRPNQNARDEGQEHHRRQTTKPRVTAGDVPAALTRTWWYDSFGDHEPFSRPARLV